MSGSRLPRGRRLGVDPGAARVGVAVCDPDGRLATGLTTLRRDKKRDTDVAELARLVSEYEAVEVVIGRPTSLSGAGGRAVAVADDYAAKVAQAIAPVPVARVDERFTTVSASGALRAAGLDTRRQRSVIDQTAAAVILQAYLDAQRDDDPAPNAPRSEASDC
ncbi:Holliday junction resolvase RuvX [Cumulibacter manganitolerans]|uniref:Holliday junction resolvase RuvX n=1 Tax=Cumulibacter manganitolerans TaxID=1884992 RepID=UPI0012965267|nr:Holliday junction resolvase RuvX [Cumulibacter manganitolerans]